MALATVYSRALNGFDAPLVSVEVHLANGLPSLAIVGLPEAEVRESRHRVRAALIHCGFDFPARHMTVNLAPADLPKESGRFDLPIALGILAASQQIPGHELDGYEFAGELALDGRLRTVRGALAMTYCAGSAGRTFVLPLSDAPEAARAAHAIVLGAAHLREVCRHLSRIERLKPIVPNREWAPQPLVDLADVRGQPQARRALEIAAAGEHSLLMCGPPGTGKSMLAERLPGLLPPMTDQEALEQAALCSLAAVRSQRTTTSRWRERPFRAPHHTASSAALVGGGSHPQPGEISLSHLGILFLDELPEFERHVLEALREPLESGRVTLSRAGRQAEFPARFQLVAAMNPCPCGYLGHPGGRCHCSRDRVDRYRARLSGPLLDRIDLHLDVPAVCEAALFDATPGEPSEAVRGRVIEARDRQWARQSCSNARLGVADIDRWCRCDPAATELLRQAVRQFNVSARALHRVLKVARTLADLAHADTISAAAVAESLRYRPADDRSAGISPGAD